MSTIKFEGATYDLREFEHPGGSVIRAAFLTDATAIIHAYHPNVEHIRKAIEPYRQSKPGAAALYKGPLYAELKRRVYAYLRREQQSPGADFWLRLKMGGLLMGCVFSFLLLSISTTKFQTYIAALFLGIIVASVGMNVMHDASHMAIETRPYTSWNYIWQLSGDMIGLSTLGWRFLHVVQHHIHTDNEGDPDVAASYPLLRSSEAQPHLPLHYFNVLWSIVCTHVLLPIFHIHDTVHVTTGVYTWEGLRKPDGTTHTKAELAQFLLAKLCTGFLWGALFYKGGLMAWALFCFPGSALLGSIDFPGHYTTHPPPPPLSKLPKSIQQGDIIDSWLFEQLHHTNAFAPELSGYFGGLNMQIEHHLFPRLSHRHYPLIRPIVMEFCQEHNLPYNDYTLFGALHATLERVWRLSFPPHAKLV